MQWKPYLKQRFSHLSWKLASDPLSITQQKIMSKRHDCMFVLCVSKREIDVKEKKIYSTSMLLFSMHFLPVLIQALTPEA